MQSGNLQERMEMEGQEWNAGFQAWKYIGFAFLLLVIAMAMVENMTTKEERGRRREIVYTHAYEENGFVIYLDGQEVEGKNAPQQRSAVVPVVVD